MRAALWFPRALFIVYCLEAGVFLVMAPWSRAWPSLSTGFPVDALRPMLLEPLMRGVVSGFGLIHLVWGAHDLEQWLAARRPQGRARRPR